MIRRIAVLLHERDWFFAKTPYLLGLLIREWERKGFTVEIVRGVRRVVAADILIPHVDMTVIPEEYEAFLASYPTVVNRRVIDISKSKISTNLVRRTDAYTGPVIVKTDRNYGGLPELRLKRMRRLADSVPGWLIRRALSRLRRGAPGPVAWSSVEVMAPQAYRVFPSPQAVPAGVFENPSLVVEKFLPEIDQESYYVRCWYFLGDRELNIRLRSPRGVIKGEASQQCEETSVPAELRPIRQQLGLDFGKIDYVLRDRGVVVFDVNRTPATRTLSLHGLADRTARHLADGIWALSGAGASGT